MTSAAPETRTVVIEREMAHPPEKIWRALTQPHLIEEWLMKSDFKPVEGHRFQLTRDVQQKKQPEATKVVIDCEVLAVEPNRTLSYSWEAYGTETVVTFTLTPTATGTVLRMEQAGFGPGQDLAFKGSQAAWKQFLTSLERLLDERPDDRKSTESPETDQ